MAKTLLLADDSVVIQKLVGLSFANEDIELVTTDNGDDALLRAREARPDLVLADVVMPGLNGYELCEALKADAALRDMPVLLLTGTFEAFDETRAQQVGAEGHITKPFEAQVLVERVNALLSSSSPASPASPADSAYDFFESSTATGTECTGLPPESVLAASGLSGDDSFSFDQTGPGDGSDQTIALMPADSAESANAIELVGTVEAEETPEILPVSLSTGDFGSDSLEVDLLDDDSFESQQTNPLTPPALAQTMLADDLGFTTSREDAAPEMTAPGPKAEDSFDFSFGGSPTTDSSHSSNEASDPGLSGSAAPPAMIPEPPDATTDPAPELPTAEAAGVPLGAFEESSSVPAAIEVATPELPEAPEAAELPEVADLPEVTAMQETPLEDLPQLDAAQMAEPETPAATPIPGAETPSWVTEAAAPAESQATAPRTATETGLPDPATMLDDGMRDRVHDAVEKIAWEAFADLSETVVRQLVERVEAIAWEVIPQMTEAIIKEEIRRLKGGTSDSDD